MIGIVIVAHGQLARALADCAAHVLGRVPERLVTLSAGQDEARERVLADLQAALATVDDGDGVLLLTDLFGATPANLAGECLRQSTGTAVAGVAGVNLPMLLRAVNYRHLPLSDLQAKVLAAASECSLAL